ncbi:Rrf2 family transcriptional regulator [Paenibacillus faecis]|uniref:Rrf2 family transcriptional regulator n=1 Tax=Paenibacillus faecis TaxID=862114 RepID=A0A5D0D264_9BACL|nr:Rrf2 family transcriptional regulator [Paenibacillus faecis]TYA14785.1 Rrf2 family transcriptional regulator [Paenibacillus faecis]
MCAQLGTHRFHVTLGVLLLLAKHVGTLSSSETAKNLHVHAAYLRKIISGLLKLGLVEAKEGRDGVYKLKLPASHISLADVYEAVRNEKKSKKKSKNEMDNGWFSLEQVKTEIDRCTITCLKKYRISDVMIGCCTK